ncbi:hypothetical protein AWB76_04066 [Caballeronia temeraria]|uniref:Uncharacterized protein n=1 Tax=Caballeronia temeraria TaxID=1777137 RepID=A0A158BDN4_9BURK|nr:hypothetical protein [Caballeronia temeraria]SAK68184.1 hypothetical protein AWB76_04066 [Caballeronia temeraria]
MTEALFFVAGAVFTFFAVGVGVLGALAYTGMIDENGTATRKL